eukprot:1158982-Pelagomonas_calceolata.AAC.10
MRNRRAVCHAPGRPGSPYPALQRHAPSKPPPGSPTKMECMPGVNNSRYHLSGRSAKQPGKEKKRKSYVGRENSPYINVGKRGTLAQRAVSLPH